MNIHNIFKIPQNMNQPKSILEAIQSFEEILSKFYEVLPKKCVPIQIYKKIEQ